jgi:ketosteroid isomerase-like protein
MKPVFSVVLVAAFAACAAAPGADPRPATAGARASLLAADAAFGAAAEADGMAAALSVRMAEDVCFLAPGEDIIQGRARATASLAAAPAGAARMHWTTLQGAVSADGGAGYTVDAARGTRPDGSPLHWRSITFWRRGTDGTWRMEAHAGFPEPGAPENPPAGFPTLEQGIPAGARSPRGAAEAEAMMQADRDFAAYAAAHTIPEAFARFVAPWGMVAGGPQYGPAQLGQGGQPGATLVWGPVLGGAAEGGDLGYTIGRATFAAPGPDGAPVAHGSKYLSIWQRQADGSMRFVVDGGNARPAGPN